MKNKSTVLAKSGTIKLQIIANKATPSPPVGPALGQRGINIMEFCKGFNAATQHFEAGTPIPVIITYHPNKTFTFETTLPPVSYLIKKAASLEKGSKIPGKEVIAKITKEKILQIAQYKMKDMNANHLEAACRMIEGTARSMGVEVMGVEVVSLKSGGGS